MARVSILIFYLFCISSFASFVRIRGETLYSWDALPSQRMFFRASVSSTTGWIALVQMSLD
jgi:hypothetical protein